MKPPKYKPGAWVLFYRRRLAGMGQVVGARVLNLEESQKWLYTIDMGELTDAGHYDDIEEEDIFGTLVEDKWKPTQEPAEK